MNKLEIIGIAGTNGSGKDTVGKILAEKHGYYFKSVTDSLRDEAKTRGLTVDRENLRTISAEWRRVEGFGVLVDRIISTYEQMPNKAEYTGVAIASLRNPGEADRIHELGGTMVWVDADSRFRYDRIQVNAEHRDRSEEDDKTFEQFMAEEDAEMHAPEGGDATSLDVIAVKQRCNVFISNDSRDLVALDTEIIQKLGFDK
jgi:dephospho-CoA kinase